MFWLRNEKIFCYTLLTKVLDRIGYHFFVDGHPLTVPAIVNSENFVRVLFS